MGDSDLKVGQRVKIRRDEDYGPCPWPDEPTGEVRIHPLAADGEVSVHLGIEVGLSRTKHTW